MFKTLAIGLAILIPIAVAGTILVNVLGASRPVALGFLLAICASVAVVIPLVDLKLNPEASKRHRSRGRSGA